MDLIKRISDQLFALKLPILMAVFAAVVFIVPGQTVETYRALAQLLAMREIMQPERIAALHTELVMAFVGIGLLSVFLWFTARRAALTHQADKDKSNKADAKNDSGGLPDVLLWVPRLLVLIVPLAVSVGIYQSRVSSEFVDNVASKMVQVFKLQHIRGGLSERLAEKLAHRDVARILDFDGYLNQISGAMVLLGLVLFVLIAFVDRPGISRQLVKSSTPRFITTTLTILFISAIFVISFLYNPVDFPQQVGALFIISLFLGLLLLTLAQFREVHRRFGVPLIWTAVIVAVLFSMFDTNDNHPIRSVAQKDRGEAKKLEIGDAFTRWLETRKDKSGFAGQPYPIFVVAAQGGGIYAAKHAASFLGEIQDLCPGFGHHLFAISGVSGGSVGSSVFAALTKDFQNKPDTKLQRHGCVEDPAGKRKALFEDATTAILRNDLWAPLAAGLLFPDFVQRFLPRPIDSWDRSLWLDKAVEKAYDRGVLKSGFLQSSKTSLRPLTKPYLAAWDPENFPHTPALVLNATEVASGERLVVSPFVFPGSGLNFLPIWDDPKGNEKAEIAPVMSSAAGLSARFPWITPAAYFHRHETNSEGEKTPKKVRIVDGGYFENSGVVTALDLIKGVVAAVDANPEVSVEINLLVFTSAEFDTPEAKSFGELLDPIRTLFTTQTARAGIAIGQALRELRGLSNTSTRINANIIRLELNGHEYPLPLGWRLSPVTRHLISFQNGDLLDCKQDFEKALNEGGQLDTNCAKKLIFKRLENAKADEEAAQ